MRWTRRLRLTSATFAYGEIVWVRRPDAGVKFEGGQRCPRVMVSRKAGSPGRSRISRKAIAWGRPVCPPLNLYARGQHCFDAHRSRDRGCSAHPVFPAPSFFRGRRLIAKLRAAMPREEFSSSRRRPGPTTSKSRHGRSRNPQPCSFHRWWLWVPACAGTTGREGTPEPPWNPPSPTISCINISRIPQPLGQFRGM